jgi:hypothetical protein
MNTISGQDVDARFDAMAVRAGLSTKQIEKLRLSLSSYNDEMREFRTEEAKGQEAVDDFTDSVKKSGNEYANWAGGWSDASYTAADGFNLLTMSGYDLNSMTRPLADGMNEVANATANAGTYADIAREQFNNMLAASNVNISSPIKAFIDDLKWIAAGGGDIQQKFQQIKDALLSGAITSEEAQPLLANLLVASENVATAAGLQTAKQAKADVMSMLSLTDADATAALKTYTNAWDVITSTEKVINTRIEASAPDFLKRLIEGGSSTFNVTITTTSPQSGYVPGTKNFVEGPNTDDFKTEQRRRGTVTE